MVMNVLKDTAPGLEVLDLSANEISYESANAIAMALRSKKKLRSLLLEENELRSRGKHERFLNVRENRREAKDGAK